MQKFIEADYYELDWYYEECSDGNDGPCTAGMWRALSPGRGEGVGQREGALGEAPPADMRGSDRFPGAAVGDGRWAGLTPPGGSSAALGSEGEMVLRCWAREHCKLHWILSGVRCECGVGACVCARGAVFAVLALSEGRGDRVFERWLSGPAAAGPEGPPFPELRPAAQGDPRGCGSSSHVAGGSEEFAYGIHRDGVRGGGGVLGGAGRDPILPPGLSLCPEGVAHSRGQAGWSLCGPTGLCRVQATGEGSPWCWGMKLCLSKLIRCL